MASGAAIIATIGALNWFFASVRLPFAGDGGDAYRAAVVYLTIPLGTSLTAVGMLPSRLSWWEQRSTRNLALQRTSAYFTVTIVAILATLVAADRAIVPHPVTLGLQGVMAGVGAGTILLRIASFEAAVTCLIVYGLAGILVPSTAVATKVILLFGGSGSSTRLVAAFIVWIAGGMLFSLSSGHRKT